ncbi:MAG: hypothetical protein HYW57_05410 [Ignavibacteriales bacterium]|nr:hypothetical protein [Ignavibacteriales bacterium]
MKIFTIALALSLCVLMTASAQFKEQKAESRPNVSESLIRPEGSGLMFGWFDPSRLTMHHSYSLSYMTMGGQGLSVGMYTNSLFYKIADPLDVQFDVSLMHSPFSSFGSTSDFSGVYLSRAQLNYRPAENMLLQIQFRQFPALYWIGGSNRYSNISRGVGSFDEEGR